MPRNRGNTKSGSPLKAASAKAKKLSSVRRAGLGQISSTSRPYQKGRVSTSGSLPQSDDDDDEEAGATADDEEDDAENDSADELAPPLDAVEMNTNIDFPANDTLTGQQIKEFPDHWAGHDGTDGFPSPGLEGTSTQAASVSSPEPEFEVADDDDDYNDVDMISENSENSASLEKEFEKHFRAHGDEIIDQDMPWLNDGFLFDDCNVYDDDEFGYAGGRQDPCMNSINFMRRKEDQSDQQPVQEASNSWNNNPANPTVSFGQEQESQQALSSASFKTPEKSKKIERNALDEHLDRPNKPLDSTDSDTDIEPLPETTVSSPGMTLSNTSLRLSSRKRKNKSKSARGSDDEFRSRRPELKRFLRQPHKAYAETVTTPAGMKQLRFRLPQTKMDTITLRRTKTTPSNDRLHAHPAFLSSINARLFQNHYFRSPNEFSSPVLSPRSEFEHIVLATGQLAGIVGQPLPGGSGEAFFDEMDFTFDREGIEDLVDLEAVGVDVKSIRSAPILATPQSGMELGANASQDSDATPVTPPSLAQRCIEYANASPEQLRDRLKGLAQSETTLTPDIGRSRLEESHTGEPETPSLDTSPKRKRSFEDEIDTMTSPVKRPKA